MADHTVAQCRRACLLITRLSLQPRRGGRGTQSRKHPAGQPYAALHPLKFQRRRLASVQVCREGQVSVPHRPVPLIESQVERGLLVEIEGPRRLVLQVGKLIKIQASAENHELRHADRAHDLMSQETEEIIYGHPLETGFHFGQIECCRSALEIPLDRLNASHKKQIGRRHAPE